MGRRNKRYSKTLHQQAYERLTSMQVFGESKKEAVKNGTEKEKIFSYCTYHTYWQHIKYFLSYMKEKHPEVTTLKKARKYAGEWLQTRTEYVNKNGQHYSAWTIQVEAKALSKLFGIRPDDPDYFTPPPRKRRNITRSRGDAVRDRNFSIKNNDELIKFARGVGHRRRELKALEGRDLLSKQQIEDEIAMLEDKESRTAADDKELQILLDTRLFDAEYYTCIQNGKGGRERLQPIIGKYADQIVERIKNTPPNKKVWEHISSNADIHGYRSDYATALYKQYAREIKDIPYDKVNSGTGKRYQSDVYVCRKDEKGKKLDKQAMYICSKALGHNRISVVADNYLRGI